MKNLAERSLFFSSIEGDRRRYTAQDMAEYWHTFLNSGVKHDNNVPSLDVVADGNSMDVQISTGRAIIGGHLYICDGKKHTVNLASATEDRIDRLVLRLDLSREIRDIFSVIKEGTEHEPPELTREGDIYELSLAQIHVKAGKSFIEQSDIIDERFDNEVCGLASSMVTVPTDVFMREWDEWFQTVKDKTYITREEFVVEQGELKREVANLNLRLEASEYVKNGVTYGTDFATSFNMELDDSKTYAIQEVKQGDTIIKVDNAENFTVGWEISIFDDVRYEEHVIDSVDTTLHTIKLATSIEGDFIGNPTLARSMGILRGRSLILGGYGNYSKVKVDDEFIALNTETSLEPISGNDWIVACGGNLYARHAQRLFKRDFDTGEWKPMDQASSAAGARLVLTDSERYIILLKSSTYLFFDTETDTWSVEKTLQGVKLDTQPGDRRSALLVGDKIQLLVAGERFTVLEIDYDSQEISHVKTTTIPNTITGTTGGVYFYWPSVEMIPYKDTWVFTLSVRKGGSPATLKSHFVDANYNFLKQNTNVYNPSSRDGATSILFVENDKLHMYIVDADTTRKLKFIHLKYNDDLSDWETVNTNIYETIGAESGSSHFRAYILKDKNNQMFLVFSNGLDSKLYQAPIRNHEVIADEIIVLTDDSGYLGQSGTMRVAQFAFMDTRQSLIKDDMPVLMFPYNKRQDLVLRGSFFAGSGVPLNYNVNRYTIKRPSVREIVGWITHGDGIEVTDVKFNKEETYNNITVDDTAQFAGIKYNYDTAEIKFKVNVLDLDRDTRVKKIIGGVD